MQSEKAHSKTAPPLQPDEAIANSLDALRDHAGKLDNSDRETYRAVNRLALDYRAWFTGEWKTTRQCASRVLADNMEETIACANRHGLFEIARDVAEIRKILEARPSPPGKTA